MWSSFIIFQKICSDNQLHKGDHRFSYTQRSKIKKKSPCDNRLHKHDNWLSSSKFHFSGFAEWYAKLISHDNRFHIHVNQLTCLEKWIFTKIFEAHEILGCMNDFFKSKIVWALSTWTMKHIFVSYSHKTLDKKYPMKLEIFFFLILLKTTWSSLSIICLHQNIKPSRSLSSHMRASYK